MGFYSRLKSRFFNLRRSQQEQPNPGLFFWRTKSLAGVPVSHDTALTYAAVWACVRVIAESIAQMSWHVMGLEADGSKTYQSRHPVNWLLLNQANPEMSAFTFRETLIAWALLWGNGYAEIERSLSGSAVWLWPISPDRVNPDRTADGALYYDIANKRQSNSVLPARDMLHLHGLGFDGTMGYSVVSMARQSLGLGLALDNFASSYFGNGAHPRGAIKYPGKLTDEAKKNIKTSFEELYGGTNTNKTAVLDNGMEFQQFTIPPNDSQFLESRKFQVQEICRWFRVPPHKLADLERATFSNIEHQAIEFVVDTLVPWCVRLEQETDMKVFGQNRGNLFTKLNVNALLRGDLESRYRAYNIGINGGWLTINDVLRLEDQNPIGSELGDAHRLPKNMTFVDDDGDILFETGQEQTPVGDLPGSMPVPDARRNGALH